MKRVLAIVGLAGLILCGPAALGWVLPVTGEGACATPDRSAEAVNGLEISLEVKPPQWKVRTDIEFACTVKNVSDKPIRVAEWGLGITHVPIEVTDAAGRVRRGPGGRESGMANLPADAFVVIEPGKEKRFVLMGLFAEKKQFFVSERLAGYWQWELPDGDYTVRAVFTGPPNDPAIRGKIPDDLWSGKAVSNAVKVTAGAKNEAAHGEAVNGLELSFDVKPTTWTPGADIQFTCTAKNVSDTPVTIAAWGLDLNQAIEVVDSKGRALPNDGGRNATRPIPADAFPTIEPGQSKAFTLTGRLTDKKMLIVNELLGGIWHWQLADGEYTLRAVFDRPANDEWAKRQAPGKTLWSGKAFSNPVKVTVTK